MTKLDTAREIIEIVDDRRKVGFPVIRSIVEAYKRWRTKRAKRKAATRR